MQQYLRRLVFLQQSSCKVLMASSFLPIFFLVHLLHPSLAGVIPASSTDIVVPLGNIREISNAKIKAAVNSKPMIRFSPAYPDSGRKSAILEQESILSQVDTKYGRLQEFVAGFYHPKPVVDSLRSEEEKYGNDGEKFRRVGTAVINKFEGLSNALNAAVEVPFDVAQEVGRKITTSLNTLGGKLVGIA